MSDVARLEEIFESIDAAWERQDYVRGILIILDNAEDIDAFLESRYYEDIDGQPESERRTLNILWKVYKNFLIMIRTYFDFIEPALRKQQIDTVATNAVHQLKQPVGIIQAAASGALHNLKDCLFSPETELEPLLDRILRQTARMSAIIDGMSKLSRADLGGRAYLDLNEVIPEALDMNFADEFRERGLALRCERAAAPLLVYVNRIALENILINLVANARDALTGRSDGEVIVTLSAEENGWSAFAVRDNGAGVSESVKKKLFDPFTSTKPTEQGMGMGLYLAKTAVEKMGGTLIYDDQHQPGARFVVRLPSAVDQQAKEESEHGA
jgi:signal transduction histidine kinase